MFFLPFFLFQIFCVNIQDLKFSYVAHFWIALLSIIHLFFLMCFYSSKKIVKNIGKTLKKKHWKKHWKKNYWKKHGKKKI